MIVTRELAEQLWNDRIAFTGMSQPPNDEKYGALKYGHDFRLAGEITVEERSGLYAWPYHPCLGGDGFCGLFNVGMLSYSYSPIPEPVRIGRYCSISNGLRFLDSQHPAHNLTTSIISYRIHNPLCRDLIGQETLDNAKWHVRNFKPWNVIEHDVWIGRDVLMSVGVNVGTGAIIAAGSIVTKDVPPYSIVGGNPAKFIKDRFDRGLAGALLALEWWQYDPKDIVKLNIGDPKVVAREMPKRIASGEFRKYIPTQWRLSNQSVQRVPSHHID